MKLHGFKNLTGVGIASLFLAWSGLSFAGDAPVDYTTVSKASVKIKSYEQQSNGEVEKVKVDTDTVILELTGASGDKPPKNQQLVLLNYCGAPEDWSALAVWDKDDNDLVEGAGVACLWREGSVVFNDQKDTLYQGLDIDGDYFMMDEIDMDVEIKGGKVKNKIDSSRPVCLKKFKTLAMSGYYSNGDGEPGTRVMRKAGSIKTNGAVFDTISGNEVAFWCD